ncbi:MULTISPECIES: Rieske (2Fe-2S) protein [unclassified Halomonas]|uniref:Rieske (2Fe-2S) protein n=1 Tax=unclassified Halomonas TaxID=2609666 RepID=UPI0021E492BD|nr:MULTISPECIES: Rieske 2Fe-2S domain-containing protein [unclassified Halomonas]UYG00526.1 Rieske 2Fe-2S domain-containing protein [Halomonas sp. GD1P12]WNL38399.1 Rieske 2Fe-2S domain-containing protein [Halomonas sp. PAMB 3232]WNL41699.1 Rieske 2Fe-2S domain-containing protein [Halomonas sp. PAMB 3264]
MSDRQLILCHRDDVPEGAARGFLPLPDAPRNVIVVKRNGQLYGYMDSCPHYRGGTPMAWRKDAYLNGEGTHLACHAHGALFNIETGACVSGPCLGRKLTRVPLSEALDGFISVPAQVAGRSEQEG